MSEHTKEPLSVGFTSAKKIKTTTDVDDVNAALQEGWFLLSVKSGAKYSEIGCTQTEFVYLLGNTNHNAVFPDTVVTRGLAL
jgi:hypothetical protein